MVVIDVLQRRVDEIAPILARESIDFHCSLLDLAILIVLICLGSQIANSGWKIG
jgi:hypothetical protein